MNQRKSTFAVRLSAALAGLAASAAALAVPVAETSPPPLLSGFQVDWVNVDVAPHSLADAANAMAGTGGFTILNSATQFLNTVDLSDTTVPFAGADPIFAVQVSGFIQLAAGNYQFAAYHDDGARLVIGGETVIDFPTDTSPTTTLSSVYALPAGVYSFSALGWEQGGQFVFQLGTVASPGAAIDLSSGFHAAAVPEPGVAGMLAAGLALVGWVGARRRRPGA